jgi:hypothetical protein
MASRIARNREESQLIGDLVLKDGLDILSIRENVDTTSIQ